MEYIIGLFISLILGWIYYQLQKRIGEQQICEWKQFKKDNPHFFKKPEEQKI